MTGALTLWGREQRGLTRGQVLRLCCWWAAVATLEGGRARSHTWMLAGGGAELLVDGGVLLELRSDVAAV